MGASHIKNLAIRIAAVSSFLLASQRLATAGGLQNVYVSSPEAEVCSAPCGEGQVLARPKKGTELKVLEHWYKVKLPDGAEGWVDGGSVTLSRVEERVNMVLNDIRGLLDSYVNQQRQISIKFMRLLDGEIDTDIKFLPTRIKLPKAKYTFLRLPTLEEKIEFIRKSIFVSIFSEDLEKLDSIKREIGEKQKSVRPYLRQPVTLSNDEITIEILPYDKTPAIWQ